LHNWDYRVMQSAVPPIDNKAIPHAKGRARAVLAVVTALAVAATAGLGVWQLQRAAFKETLADQIERTSKLPAIDNFAAFAAGSKAKDVTSTSKVRPAPDAKVPDTVQALVHQRVDLHGLWLHQHTAFLDNRYMGGRPGFIVATPLQISASNQVVWVQRGWVARDAQDRTRLPSLPATAEPVKVQGRVVAEVSRVYALGGATEAAQAQAAAAASTTQPTSTQANATQTLAAPPSAPGPARASRIWQNLPAVDFGPSTQLLPVAVLQTAAAEPQSAPDGLVRDWAPLDSGVAKHYGYAFQWFALCGLIMVLYAWFQFIAPRSRTL
jgi:surfeit locus 1 family protein